MSGPNSFFRVLDTCLQGRCGTPRLPKSPRARSAGTNNECTSGLATIAEVH